MALYRSILEPVMRRYRPELVMVAAGFDGHHMDSMGGTGLTQACAETSLNFLWDWARP